MQSSSAEASRGGCHGEDKTFPIPPLEQPNFQVGDLVLVNNKPAILRFMGDTKFGAGIWFGVEYINKPIGKNDGSVMGWRYFSCPMGHGLFVRETALKEYSEIEKAVVAIQSVARGAKARKQARQGFAMHAWTQLENSSENDYLKTNRDISARVTAEIRRRYGYGDAVGAARRSSMRRINAVSAAVGDTPAIEDALRCIQLPVQGAGAARLSIAEASLEDEQIPHDYDGPILTWPITEEFCRDLVRHYLRSPDVLLPRRYAWQIIAATEEELLATVTENIRHVTVPKNIEGARMVLCGDIHGQLNDFLFIFHKFGLPSPGNQYLFNGDLVDRGEHSTEILLILFAFNLCYPDCVFINRGNHESGDMNEVYGFANEIRRKYGGVVFKKMTEIFLIFPLCTIVDDRIFVVHAGLSRREAVTLAHINAIDRYRSIPENPVSFQDAVMFDLLWSDPHSTLGIGRSSRGPDGVVFGPDVTERFLNRNRLEVCIRSHEVPSTGRGFEVMHQGKCVTIFSASNYCGTSNNYGGVILFQADLSFEIQEYWSPSLPQLAELVSESELTKRPAKTQMEELSKAEKRASIISRDNAADKISHDVIDKLKKIICEKKAELWWWFWSVDPGMSGKVAAQMWREGCASLLGDSLPWMFIQKVLDVVDNAGMVDYERFLRRFRVVYKGKGDFGAAWRTNALQQVFDAILNCDLSLRETLDLFDRKKDGTVSFSDFQEFFTNFCPGFTKSQVTVLLSTVTSNQIAQGDADGRIHVADFLARFEVVYRSGRNEPYGEPWIEDALKLLGRLIRKQSPDAVLTRLGITNEKAADISPSKRNPQRIEGSTFSSESSDKNSSVVGLEAVRRRSTIMRAFTLLDTFQRADVEQDGFLSYQEFVGAIRTLPLEEAKNTLGFELTEEKLWKLAESVDITGNEHINYLEFLQAFQVVNRAHEKQDPGTDVWEEICNTVFKHTHTLRRALQQFDVEMEGTVSPSDLQKALEALNNALSQEGRLTSEQVETMVGSLEGDKIRYEEFLSSFVVVDTEEGAESTHEVTADASTHAGDGS